MKGRFKYRYLWLLPPLLAAGALLFVNIYVQSDRMRDRLRTEIGRALGMEVEIVGCGLTPWSGFSITGVTSRELQNAGPQIQVDRFQAFPDWMELASGKLVLKEIRLTKPTFVWREMEAAPVPEPVFAVETPPEPVAEAEAADPQLSEEPTLAPMSELAGESVPLVESGPAWENALLTVFHGEARVLDGASQPVLTLHDVHLTGVIQHPFAIVSKFRCEDAVVLDLLHFDQVNMDVSSGPEGLTLSEGRANLGGGRFQFQGSLQTPAPGMPFAISANFKDVQAGTLLEHAGIQDIKAGGIINGEMELRGYSTQFGTQSGSGEIRVSDAFVRDHPVLAPIGRAFNIKELEHFPVETGLIRCRVVEGMLVVDTAELSSTRVGLKAAGRVDVHGNLKLNATLRLDGEVAKLIPAELLQGITHSPVDGSLEVPFLIAGTLQEPRSDLLERALSGGVGKEVGRWMEHLLRQPGGKSPR